MVNVAVLGYGIVGSGVLEVINKNSSSISVRAGEEIKVKRILDVRDFPDDPYRHILTKNPDDIFNDDSIDIIVETIGGARIAYEFTKRAFKRGKHVVTSNKELVATHGPELLALAKENKVNYLFEASVGGGIPIIRPLNQCLAANEIHGITGILNGTTNYILSQMKREGKDFATALRGAQEKGYAEADPTADVEGHDACRKIAILSSIAYNQYVNYKDIYTEGISKLTLDDMVYAEAMNSVIKLIATSSRVEDRISARVSPAIISKEHPLATVEDVFNAIVVKGDAIGDAMFYGRGAGKLPTASAVVADIIDIVKHIDTGVSTVWNIKEENNVIDILETETKYFVRLNTRSNEEARKLVNKVFGNVSFINKANSVTTDEVAFVTELKTEGELKSRLDEIKGTGSIKEIINIIRVVEE